MHLAIYTLAAIFCPFSASALPLPLPLPLPRPESTAENAAEWDLLTDDPIRRRDSPRHNLVREPGGFIETVGPVRREEDWAIEPYGNGVVDTRDSPLHTLPDEGIFGSGAPEPLIEDPHAWFVEFYTSPSEDC